MTTQFRDTQFGHLVRFLSGNKLFRYPDENDPSLWKRSLQRDTTSASTQSGEQSNSLEKSKDPNDSINASATDFDTQGVDLQGLSVNHVVEDGKDIYLVDWYGPDDPEVSAPLGSMRQIFLTQTSESPELAQQLEVAGRFSNLLP
jgi:DHA1 family multidrug resistance protein-like MFS transporter